MMKWGNVLFKLMWTVILITVFLFGLQVYLAFHKDGYYYYHQTAGDLASGLEGPGNNYDVNLLDEDPKFGAKTCRRGKEMEPYWHCLTVKSAGRETCGFFESRTCVSLRINKVIFQEPEMFARIVQSLDQPCQFVPKPETVFSDKVLAYRVEFLRSLWTELQCDTNPERYQGEVTLFIMDDTGKTVMTILKE